ncbi:DUF416 family protein [Chamaesiphon sp. OTE_8_metabat_110]|uniref:DUF416 family protein n=1 Tax=Chamaesiphon sp. OTE_8_metabat_110 TaxID=2964696 RepID=UPI00286B7359|nr:DUF416 family protein [Chamaesiphon sp. OTE_8_metabat_110]
MVLTVKDAIEQEKNLSEFIPFVEIAIQVKQLPFHHQVAFFCSCCERMLPIWTLIDGCDDSLDMSNLRATMDELWQIAGGMDIQELEIESLTEKIATSIEDYEYNYSNDDDCEEIHKQAISLATHVSDMLNQVVGYVVITLSDPLSDNKINLFLKIFVTLIFTIYEYLDIHFYSLDSLWELKKSRKDQDVLFLNHLLTQSELKKEQSDLNFLTRTLDLTPELLSEFRAKSCPNGVSVLGSIDKVRATLS